MPLRAVPPSKMRQISERITKARVKVGITQEHLARLCEVSESTVSQWESGQKSLSLWSLIKLCEVLNVSSSYLLGV
jgi:transcriptional regulator with XRE-family HTH domain